jgi:hypothetical protein
LEKTSSIMSITLSKSHDTVRTNELLTLNLSFRIQGKIREVFEQRNWERAYDRNDNTFRLTTKVALVSNRNVVSSLKFIRKGVLFWTRSPKIPYRIWIMIVKDDNSFYPTTADEAKALLFDVDKVIEINGSDLKPGKHIFHADINVSWGKHYFSEPSKLHAKSNEIQIVR